VQTVANPHLTSDPPQQEPPRGGAAQQLRDAQAYCRRLAKSHYENFTVASWLLPRDLRQHFCNIYAYCRTADDLADETDDAGQNLARLDDWEKQLRACYAGNAEHPVFLALADTARRFEIPIEPLADLLVAFRQDQRIDRYETIDELLEYCRYSANPVGQLVLRLGRCCNQRTIPLSDSVCTGLQLVNFWQDVARDWRRRRRIYLPQQTLRRFGCSDASIVDGVARGFADEQLRAAIACEVERAEGYLQRGWPLIEQVTPELRIDVELFIRGGLAVAGAIGRQNFDVLARRPVVGKAKKLSLLAHTWWRQNVADRPRVRPPRVQ